MKKILILLAVLWTAPAFAQVSNTVNPPACGTTSNLNSAGCSNFGTSLYTFLAAEDANRWQEQMFGNSVSTLANANACLGGTSAGLTMTPTSCVAYNAGFRGTETGSITFPDASICWVSMDYNTSGSNAGLPASARVAGTHYLLDCSSGSAPTEPANAQLLMEVVTSGGAITAVTDKRTPFLNLLGSLKVAGDANLFHFTIIQPGTFTTPSVYTNNAGLIEIGGIDVGTLEDTQEGSFNNDTLGVGVEIPVGASPGVGTGNTSPIAAYYDDKAPGYTAGGGTNAVGIYNLGLCDGTDAKCWGINTQLNDNGTSTGMILQNEFDASVNTTTTLVRALDITGGSTAQSTDAVGILFETMDHNAAGTPRLIPWTHGIEFDYNATSDSIYNGPACGPTGGPCNSQLNTFAGLNSGNVVKTSNIGGDDLGGFHIYPGAGANGFIHVPGSNTNVAMRTGAGLMLGTSLPSDEGNGTINTDANGGYYRNGLPAIEYSFGLSGLLGGLTSTAAADLLQVCDIAQNAGHFTNLVITTDLDGGTCNTAPTFNVRDSTASTTGTQKAGSTSAGAVGQAQTLVFSAGDTICITRTVNGGTCTVPTFSVQAHVAEP